jgi:NitT/TauT family transport system substrate-binding protein
MLFERLTRVSTAVTGVSLLLLTAACAPAAQTPVTSAPPATSAPAPGTAKPAAASPAGSPGVAASPASSPAAAASPASSPAAAAPAATVAPGSLGSITIITTAASGAFSGIWTAAEAGYFRDEGLNVTLSSITDTARAIPAVVANEAQFATLDATVVIGANLSGADLRSLAAVTNRLAFSLMTQPEIKRPEDLKGKTLGISGFGSSTDTAARLALAGWGLSPDTDVSLVPAGGVPPILAGMTAKQFDAGIMSPPTNTRARQAGFYELINLAKDGPEYPSVTLGALRTYAEQNPRIVTAVIRAYSRGLQRFKTDKAFGKQVLTKYLLLDDDVILEDTWAQFAPIFDVPPYVTARGFQTAIDFVAQSLPAAKGTSADGYLDSSFVKQLDDSGFFKQLSP